MRYSVLVLLAGCALPGAAAADMCKWKDAKGQTHFSERAPKGVLCEGVRAAPPPAASPNQDDLQKFVKDADKAEATADKKKEEVAAAKAQREKRCDQARRRIDQLQNRPAGSRLVKKNDKGEDLPVAQEEYDAWVAEAQAQQQKSCD